MKLLDLFRSRPRVVTRIAPSPTGTLHVGTARSALFNYLFARRHGGTFILRIEDTDRQRSTKEFENDIVAGMEWLGLPSDAFYRQSQRGAIYSRHIKKLLQSGAAYQSREAAKNDPEREVEVIRLKNPGSVISFTDLIRGPITFNTAELGDFVIARSIADPLYHLAAVIDDYEMKVTHVIRGEDHISNTPRQILIQQALGFPRPIYAHIPLILAPDRSKLSKRHGATSITEYRKKGFLPEAMVNYLALLGWNPGTDQELFSLKELTQIFELERVQKGGAVFNIEKLEWLNQQYLRKLPEKAFSEEFMAALPERVTRMPEFSKERVNRMLPLIRERIHTFADVSAMAEEGEFDYYFSYPDYQTADLLWKGSTDLAATKRRLEHVYSLLGRISDNDFVFSEKIKAALWEYASAEGRGEVLWPTRYALSGKKQSPDPFIIASVIGKGPTLARLKTAIEKITSSSSRHDPS